jgi:hypothetical protein
MWISTLLPVDHALHVEIYAQNEQVGHGVRDANTEQDVGVIKRNPLRDLHHSKDDNQVGSVVEK